MKRVTFKEFFITIGCGLWQVICWVANIFGYKDDSKYGLFVRRFFAGCLSVIVFAVAVLSLAMVYKCLKTDDTQNDESEYVTNTYVSRNIYYHDTQDGLGYIFNMRTGEKLIKHVAWIAKPEVGDSIVCYSDGKNRGYFNALTGRVVIPATYKRAWAFSDGLAAVQQGDSIVFLRHDGKLAFRKSIVFSLLADGYRFHGGYCIIAWGDCHYGLINKKGEWALPPVYLDMHRANNGYWIIKDKNGYGLMSESMKMMLPCKYRYVDADDSGILVQYDDYSMQRLNGDLSVKDDFVCSDVEPLVYSSNQVDVKGHSIVKGASCQAYKVEAGFPDHYGLMDAAGKPLTKPSFEEIDAVGSDLYLCKVGTEGILLNGRGKKVN